MGVQTYVDMHGNLRVKSETLVAMSEITSGSNATFDAPGDADDDAIFADAIITITSQPESVGVGTTATATFSVTASVIPSYATLVMCGKKMMVVDLMFLVEKLELLLALQILMLPRMDMNIA